jgi:hypothetical protein
VTYLLDTMIVSYFLQAQRESELATAALEDPKTLDDVMAVALTSPQQQPTWWAPWRAGFASAGAAVVAQPAATAPPMPAS